jgi:hypothetical protein
VRGQSREPLAKRAESREEQMRAKRTKGRGKTEQTARSRERSRE